MRRTKKEGTVHMQLLEGSIIKFESGSTLRRLEDQRADGTWRYSYGHTSYGQISGWGLMTDLLIEFNDTGDGARIIHAGMPDQRLDPFEAFTYEKI